MEIILVGKRFGALFPGKWTMLILVFAPIMHPMRPMFHPHSAHGPLYYVQQIDVQWCLDLLYQNINHPNHFVHLSILRVYVVHEQKSEMPCVLV